ncbi:MAG TPA: PfkB family carbohydrate kinase [Nocardioidaceae bacterium]|nr:PfkB family carbohydrate kinase [Nocardioidaceae bacterium]
MSAGRPPSTGSVLVAGESLVDVVIGPDGQTIESAPGGAPLNIAVGLARLGVPTALLTTIGADDYGERVARHVHDSGVALHEGVHDSGSTSVARALLDEQRHATYEFALSWDPPEAVLPANCAAVHIGSLGTVIAPGDARMADLAARARAAGVVVSYDPNVRPAVLGDVADPWSDVRRIAAGAAVVKLSDQDGEYLQPGRSLDDLLDALLRGEHTQLAAITRGEHGLLLATEDHRLHVPAPKVDVVDTVGAGDACMAGLLAALHQRGQLDRSSLRRLDAADLDAIGAMAARVAALTCARRGANPPWLAELDGGA